MNRILAFCLLVLGLAGCQVQVQPAIPNQVETQVTATVSPSTGQTELPGVIFSQEEAEQMDLGRLLASNVSGYWTPGQEDVIALEGKLEPYLEQAASQSYYGPLKPLDEYKRQYVGILIDGQQVIAVNFFCDPLNHDWQREFVFVMDGGACFFELKYNVKTAEFYDLSIHGES